MAFAEDDFNRPNGSLTSAAASDGGTWAVVGSNGAQAVVNGRCEPTSGVDWTYHDGEPSSADYTVSGTLDVEYTGTADLRIGVSGRTDPTSGETAYLARWHSFSSAWQIYRVVEGTHTLLDSESETRADVVAASPGLLELELVGSSQVLRFGGVEKCSASDAVIEDPGFAGIYSRGDLSGNIVGTLDDFSATDAGGGGTTVSADISESAEANNTFAASIALSGAFSAGVSAGYTASGQAIAGASITEGTSAGDSQGKIVDVLASVSGTANATSAQSAIIAIVGAISEGVSAGESWAADAQALADLVSSASAGEVFSEGSISTLQGALTSGTSAGQTFAGSVQALASIASSASAAEVISALSVIAGVMTSGVSVSDTHSAISVGLASFTAGAVAGASFNFGNAIGYLSGTIVMEAALGGTVTINPSLDGTITLN